MAKIKRVFEQIEETIERDALQLSPGEFLPSEMQYSRTLAVSRLTVRKAVDDIVYDFYGEENPCNEEDYNLDPSKEMQMGGM